MSDNDFVDYYELLQLSSSADTETIERVFRHLAKKFHPDHAVTANKELFIKIVEAHKLLSDPVKRAGYDVAYQKFWSHKWGIAAESGGRSEVGDDTQLRDRMLTLLYFQRRRNMKHPGLGELEISRLLSTPIELVEFHIWYVKAKGWVERLDMGQLAITAEGVDQVEKSLILSPDHLIEAGKKAKVRRDDGDLHAANE